jgi:hypothetical protein
MLFTSAYDRASAARPVRGRRAVSFAPHAAANGLTTSSDPAFGFAGDAFVALFGDVAPITTRPLTPVGYKVVRVDLGTREIVDFAVNRIEDPASKLPHNGFERPCSHRRRGVRPRTDPPPRSRPPPRLVQIARIDFKTPIRIRPGERALFFKPDLP